MVDLCPCINLTVGAKRKREAELRSDPHDGENYGRWQHICRHTYGEFQLAIGVRTFLHQENGVLGVNIAYRLEGPSDQS